MRRFPPTQRKKSRIEIIPMIDVMMFLLVFFVLISINVIPSLGMKMKLPASSQAQSSIPPQRAIVGLFESGKLEIDGQGIESLPALSAELVRRKREASNGLAILIKGEDSVQLQRLVDLMDELKANGIESITIATRRR